jgi:hypothetical protein
MARVRVFNPSPTRKNLFGFGRSREVSGPQPGDSVKVRFSKRGESELMWVQVTGKRGKKYSGVLDNEPVVINKQIGDRVSFSKSQIVGNNPSDATTTQRSNSMQRRVRTNQQQPAASGAATGTAIADVTASQDSLRKQNERLKQKIESMQDTLDEIADEASAPADGSELDPDTLATKLDAILDLAAPGSCDDDDDDTDV